MTTEQELQDEINDCKDRVNMEKSTIADAMQDLVKAQIALTQAEKELSTFKMDKMFKSVGL